MVPDNNIKIEQAECSFLISSDVDGKYLRGSMNYFLNLPAGMPSCRYWSVIAYDVRTGLIVKNNQLWPSVHGNCKNLIVNEDGSVNVYFGPDFLPGKEYNYIQTSKGRVWYMIFRLYDLTDIASVKDWCPGEIEPYQIS
jgi:hypothetical protein